MKVKLYRHTIKSVEYLPGGREFTYYDQTNWSSIKSRIPGEHKEIVLIEEKEVEISEGLLK